MNKIDILTAQIRVWALARGLKNGDVSKQALKLGEEYGELCEGLVKGNDGQVIDSIGNMYVVLTILALQNNIHIEECIEIAYEEIKERKGKLVDGVFIKEGDLK